jgi:hypothetical protein
MVETVQGVSRCEAFRGDLLGATDHMIMAWGGWKTLKEVQRYTEAENCKRLALQAADKIIAGTEVANLEIQLANQDEKR